MEKISITIDGKQLTAEKGQTILSVARANGIDIPTLCHAQQVKAYGACGICLVEAEGMPRLLRSCSTQAADSMVIHTHTERVDKARKIALELLMSDHEGDCLGPCTINCPAHTNCQGYVKQIAEGNYYEAAKIIKEKIPLPSSIGRICPHPCETDCRRKYVEEPVSICSLKAFAGDMSLSMEDPYRPEKAPATGKKVAIIGGGPAGLTTAYYLAIRGHAVTIYDAMPQLGGMLRYGIPEYRLPKDILDQEIEEILSLGIESECFVNIGKDITFSDLQKEFDAVVIAIGAWKSIHLRCEGNDLDGVFGGIEFLCDIALEDRPEIGKNVAIVGGGNTAMDACRTAVRLGAENVYVIYRRTRDEMPAEDIEIEEAMEEGVTFKFLTNPVAIHGENGHVTDIKLQIMELGEPDASGRRSPIPVEGKFETLKVDSVISALGHILDDEGFEEFEKTSHGNIAADSHTFKTSHEGVFAVGEATNEGASIAVTAIGEAGKTALMVDAYLHGIDLPESEPFLSKRNPAEIDFSGREKKARTKMPVRPADERKNDFCESNLGFSEEQAKAEAKRCLECGCFDYHDCSLIKYANQYPISPERIQGEKHPLFREERLDVIQRDQGKCILCGLCVRVCDEDAGQGILGLVGRGFNTVIKPEFQDKDIISVCRTCKKCAELCPTGALKIIG